MYLSFGVTVLYNFSTVGRICLEIIYFIKTAAAKNLIVKVLICTVHIISSTKLQYNKNFKNFYLMNKKIERTAFEIEIFPLSIIKNLYYYSVSGLNYS